MGDAVNLNNIKFFVDELQAMYGKKDGLKYRPATTRIERIVGADGMEAHTVLNDHFFAFPPFHTVDGHLVALRRQTFGYFVNALLLTPFVEGIHRISNHRDFFTF